MEWQKPCHHRDGDRIPLFDGEKQQKMPIQALRRPNTTLQVVDLTWI
jgi:hypothetical protein